MPFPSGEGNLPSRREVRLRVAAILLLAGTLLLGLAHIALLPPWEGFDETAHFSYLQQIADNHSRPKSGGHLSADVERYGKIAPTPYAASPPFNENGNWTYFRFFAAPADVVEAGRAAVHGSREPAHPWMEGDRPNWQSQHPPAYYVLLAPLYSLSRHWTLAGQLFLLRGASYILPWLGLCVITILALRSRRFAGDEAARTTSVLAAALWPCFFPSWFPEMARLGNDSLVAFLIALTWLMVVTRLDGHRHNYLAYLIVGVLCGIGLLAKALFLPFAALLAGGLLLRAVIEREDAIQLRRRAIGTALSLFATAAIAGWWYAEKYVETGSLLGANDTANLIRAGGLVTGLYRHISDPWLFISGVSHIGMTFRWSSTWSLIHLPRFEMLLMLPFAALAFGLVWRLRNLRLQFPDWLSICTLAAVLLGMFYHAMVFIAAYASAGAPGWYLHAYAPVVAPLLGFALAGLSEWRRLRWVIALLLLYPILFLTVIMMFQMAVFSGCVDKRADMPIPNFAAAPCATDVAVIFERLGVLAYPATGAALFAAGLLLMLAGNVAAMRLMLFDRPKADAQLPARSWMFGKL
jgi:hypothetical protein